MRVLIVEDQEAIRFAVSSFLRTRGYTVDVACDPDEARHLIQEHHYDLTLTDLRFDGTDESEGLALADELRRRFPEMSVFIITAYGAPELEAWSRERGIDRILSKPLKLDTLERYFRRALGTSQSDGPPSV